MRAVVYTGVGKTEESLRMGEIAKPSPGAHQVLVRVKASAITNMEYMRFGSIGLGRVLNLAMPAAGKPLGVEFAGIVEEIGDGVKGLKKGDAVFGLAKGFIGAWAEYVLANEKEVAPKPDSLSFEQAGALPTGGITALGAVCAAKIRPGQEVLIQGASGGVGHFVVQLAKAYGGIVTAVCSTRNVEMAQGLGADHVIDYKKEDIAGTGKTYDRIIAVNGYHPLSVYKKLLNQGGRYVLIGGTPKALSGMAAGPVRAIGSGKKFGSAAFPFQPKRQRLEELGRLADEGKVKPYIDHIYTPDETAKAIEYVLAEHPQGKVAFRMEF
ncbi:NAD(P)-dependent alcohol dehydrogenase [Muricomes intestini]|jgi:NADPH:quinone reductase-like Zn-dependent oxidoreductase|uniref:NADPH:quinone reductase-like Zn-dependent oxidoreductase n=3 Tax=Muricomes intestini TaxID=1796634 RepID=A0A4R3K4L0_9FIRM|nr:NAD(P)-dependent alcohol dehydrogenase [Muricomes intestini]TCS77709.1 NADPH:quinone reductase-like Zn-dependent oxidoreductase [Muricomes intestini]HBI71584.1 alcohol dehydrogenase [Lachnospiraceae bacterium]HCR83696.1 alcohol dehydrogenase [Lachnospiraceae bacterium]